MSVKNMFKLFFIFGVAFTCQAHENNDCLLPEPPKNGYLISDQWGMVTHSIYDPDITKYVMEDTSLAFSCDRKYKLEGKELISCVKGSFQDEVPVCVKKYCDEPPAIENSYYRRYARPVFRKGTRLLVYCAEGYRRESGSPKIVQCIRVENELKWSTDLPICEKIASCGDPGTPLNGERVGNSFHVGDTVSFSCGGKDVLVGSEVLTCSYDGVWDNPRPRCRPPLSCPDPPVQDHVQYEAVHQTRDYFIPGDEVNVLCDEGFAIYEGIDHNFCTDKKYDYYEDEENILKLSAEVGNEPIPPFWSETFPKCEEVFCTAPSIPKHGFIKEFGQRNLTYHALHFKFEYTISYACKKGYQIIGAHFSECTESGWRPKKPYCRKITCSIPPTPDDGWENVKMGTGSNIGDIVQFGCFPGFTLSGAVERECLENGQWSGEPAVCVSESTHCPNPGSPLHGSKFGNNYNLGAEVSFTCDFDYTLIGSPVRQCMPNRVWSGEEVVCKKSTDFDRTSALQYRLLSNLNSMVLLQDAQLQPNSTTADGKLPEDIEINEKYVRSFDTTPAGDGSLVLYFIFDSSRSVGRKNFNRSIDFVKALVQRIGVSVGGVRVGAATFGNKINKESFVPNEYTNTAGVLQGLENLKKAYSEGDTNIHRALRYIESNVLPLIEGTIGKEGKVTWHVFLLSDGAYNAGGDPTSLATEMKEAGVKFSCVAISGEKLNLKALYQIASDRKDVYELKDNEELERIVDVVLNGTVGQIGHRITHNVYRKERFFCNKIILDIPDTSKLYAEKTVGWAIGYGKFTDEPVNQHELFSTLREVDLKIRSEEECSNDLLGTPVLNYTTRMFCAGGEKGKDICYGDSGGPFMKYQYNADGQAYWIQTGITSFSPRNACGLEGHYGYYTKVATVRDWIDETIQNN